MVDIAVEPPMVASRELSAPSPPPALYVPSPCRTAASPSSPPPFRRLPNGCVPANHLSSPLNPSTPPSFRLSSSWFEIRLFYVRFSPCATDAVPSSLTLSHLRREIGAALEINGAQVPASETIAVPLSRDRLDREASEVTYVSIDGVRLTGAVDFEVCDDRENLLLCGSLERVETTWSNGVMGFDNHHQDTTDNDQKTGWSMDCYSAASISSSAFLQPKLGISSPSVEVYIAGRFAGFPLILTQTIQLSPRRKTIRPGALYAIPEGEEATEREAGTNGGLVHPRTSSNVAEDYSEDYDPDIKLGHSYYPEGWYTDEDGQLSWFNAGVRVGVGIGLGMCVGLGIGVGLLMRSYQATTRSFRRRFF